MSESKFDRAAHAERMRKEGWWQDLTADDLLDRAIAADPDKTAIVAYRADAGYEAPVATLSYSQLGEAVSKAAGAFSALGIGKGDVVGIMLPNWVEFVISALALTRIGAVPNPLMHIFRERELRFMCAFAETKAMIVPKTFRGHDFEAMMDGLRSDLPDLAHVIVVGGDGANSYDALIAGSDAAPLGPKDVERIDPGAMSVLMYTSGTTGEPKGVMHCQNTMIACVKSLGERFGLRAEDVQIGSTPFGHMTGYTAVMYQTLYYGGTMVLMDIWLPDGAVPIMTREGVTHMAAATPFLADICRKVEEGQPAPKLRTFLCGGAQIPPIVVERARDLLDLNVSSLWGMTESLAGTLTEPERAAEKSASTDGRAVDGVELLIADEELNPMPTGETGRLYFRGSQQFLGYYKKPGLGGRSAEGWFDTGDLAYMDAEGYIRIDGRSKDIIIRGGENVPVFEIESILYRHPRVADVAIVGYPDARMGERGCAFIAVNDGGAFGMDELTEWMAKSGAAKQYWPEAVEVIETMPRTASGKIQKFVLKDQAAKYSS
ncbi:AMP-binding protein [Mesobacterium pallidum]|uniref:AMP-binding protein n=1 Tax=Mesobacterium pallidum TaxID=2872037 RepID=UPI001EE16C67|nr:AMP-binding protein [Mesobacterium pallidum]